eukprot:TRINITY_DN12418_c0_g2_i3.p1 TRINITY_DN12418_c0_g2~~TRINITY_DN12418_c0_g2_i3.p1  ORF type:complete len:377 (+),score=78.62 TRINITY_DN12418_c0_g2_i3:53-1183(+)
MAGLTKCLSCCGVVVALLAVLLGLFHAGRLRTLAPYLTNFGSNGNKIGLTPSIWGDKPWLYEFSQLPRLDGKVAIVTGANAGLGFWTALHLARQGAHVYAGCRSEAKCAKAIEHIKANTSSALVEPAIVDVSSLKSVRAFAATFREKHTTLDIYVANAGIPMAGAQERTPEGIEPIFATNHVGHQLMYMLLEDLIQAAAAKTGDARVVAVSSAAHFDAVEGCPTSEKEMHEWFDAEYPLKMQAYARSKLANVLFAQEVASRNRHSQVFANSVHPGAVATEIFSKDKKHVKENTSPGLEVFRQLAEYLSESMWASEEGALTQVYLAAASEIREQNTRGRYFHPQAEEVLPLRPWAFNWTHQKALWQFTEELIASRRA